MVQSLLGKGGYRFRVLICLSNVDGNVEYRGGNPDAKDFFRNIVNGCTDEADTMYDRFKMHRSFDYRVTGLFDVVTNFFDVGNILFGSEAWCGKCGLLELLKAIVNVLKIIECYL